MTTIPSVLDENDIGEYRLLQWARSQKNATERQWAVSWFYAWAKSRDRSYGFWDWLQSNDESYGLGVEIVPPPSTDQFLTGPKWAKAPIEDLVATHRRRCSGPALDNIKVIFRDFQEILPAHLQTLLDRIRDHLHSDLKPGGSVINADREDLIKITATVDNKALHGLLVVLADQLDGSIVTLPDMLDRVLLKAHPDDPDLRILRELVSTNPPDLFQKYAAAVVRARYPEECRKFEDLFPPGTADVVLPKDWPVAHDVEEHRRRVALAVLDRAIAAIEPMRVSVAYTYGELLVVRELVRRNEPYGSLSMLVSRRRAAYWIMRCSTTKAMNDLAEVIDAEPMGDQCVTWEEDLSIDDLLKAHDNRIEKAIIYDLIGKYQGQDRILAELHVLYYGAAVKLDMARWALLQYFTDHPPTGWGTAFVDLLRSKLQGRTFDSVPELTWTTLADVLCQNDKRLKPDAEAFSKVLDITLPPMSITTDAGFVYLHRTIDSFMVQSIVVMNNYNFVLPGPVPTSIVVNNLTGSGTVDVLVSFGGGGDTPPAHVFEDVRSSDTICLRAPPSSDAVTRISVLEKTSLRRVRK